MATPHIQANKGDFSDTVLLPGDPLRAQFIADTFLTDVREVNRVRNMLGFTGRYQGREISVMGHGMGIPSISIYAKELITDYDVKTLIRVGSCGAVRDDVKLRDVVIGLGASTDSKVNRTRFMDHDFAAIADFNLVSHAVSVAREKHIPLKVGNLFSADLFYSPQHELFELMKRYGIVGIEMEAAGLYGVAAEYGARAMTICTVSDHILRGEALSSDERQTTFNEMIEVTLEAVLRDDSTHRSEG
ncbi:purine nucleoside phosphorylase DeoD-type [Litchfieldella qijiaojingensis]|uniref:Purine nucleoside phosphorylase DeoD-type n=1 Tax=Litchfieldella qijiaojingensis TaxID=980347 RepID=A0ABQ2YQS4_9GAMM|nr:purine-nucleoside phosphorylase [Halomonas qijiaojingensis]GGX92320.1 purine nucleoside phosphorylase DeoD-type [Halomonas qijiaojingensis]